MNNFNIISYLANFKEGESGTIPPIPKPIPPEPAKPFYIEDTSGTDNSLSLTKNFSSAPNVQFEYSTDGTQWQEWVDLYNSPLPIKANSKVYLRGTNQQLGIYKGKGDYFYNSFDCTKKYNVGGDVTTLLVPEGKLVDLTGHDYCFVNLFENSLTIENAKNLNLFSNILSEKCYEGMFWDCSSLITAPVLPATQLATDCYLHMFYCCSSLITAPVLPAMQLATDCYNGMFYGCSSLITAPVLPATKLYARCYRNMFEECTSLLSAPNLPATQLVVQCYDYMFTNCKKLKSIEVGATTWDIKIYSNGWVRGVAPNGTFVKPKELTNIPIGENGIPDGWEVVNK